MEDKFWYLLIDELSSDFRILPEGGEIYVRTANDTKPLIQYISWLNVLTNRFIGECGRNIDEATQGPEDFKRLLLKLNYYFQCQFNINFPDGAIPYPLQYGNLSIPAVNTAKDPLISVVKAKIDAFGLAISFLKAQLSLQTTATLKARIRKKAGLGDFHTEYNATQLVQILSMGIYYGFFSENTDQKDFIDIFSGRPAARPLNWTCTVYSLSEFIKGINGEGLKKITDGKWLVTSKLFVIDNKSVLEESLCRASSGKNDRLKQLKSLIDCFNHPLQYDD